MSDSEAVLGPGSGAAVAVTEGTVDTFIVLPAGGIMALVSVTGPCTVLAPATGPDIRIVPRIGARLATARAADPSRLSDLSPFRTALAGRAPEELRATVEQASARDLPTVLSGLIAVLMDEGARRRDDLIDREIELDQQTLQFAYRDAARTVLGSAAVDAPLDPDSLLDALVAAAQVEGCRVAPAPARGSHDDLSARLTRIARASDFDLRPIDLTGDWQRPQVHALLAFRATPQGREPVALVPTAAGYRMQRGSTGPSRRLTPDDLGSLESVAYQLLPRLNRQTPARVRDLIRLSTHGSGRDWAVIAVLGAAAALLALLTPMLTSVILGTLIPAGEIGLVGQAGVALVTAALLAGVLVYVQYRTISRAIQRSLERGQNALWDRLLSLPVSFFRRFDSGDLAMRAMSMDWLAQIVNAQVIGAVLAAAFSLVNVALMFWFDVWLGLAGLSFLLLTLAAAWWATNATERLYRAELTSQLATTSWVVQMLVGIEKIRLTSSEARFSSRYLELLRRQVAAGATMTAIMGRLFGWLAFAGAAAMAVFAGLILARSGNGGPDVTGATYLAFSAAFGAAFAAVSALASVVVPVAAIRPVMSLLAPIIEQAPESANHRTDPGQLTGRIEFRQVTFRYAADETPVLSDVSFRAGPGEMVAIVGPSGAGKSTMARLLLGFEEPDDGEILLDGKSLHDLDLESVRAQIGAVVQNGQLMRGTVLENILGGVDGSERTAWEAAAAAALADDVRAMPMKMHTLVDPQLISGGQAQRILLARAFVRRPPIVLLDEATSALDNIAQATVTSSMDRLGATRIVIAHRLSTLKSAQRIIVVDRGRIVQTGSYDELMAQDGEFRRLARRQLL